MSLTLTLVIGISSAMPIRHDRGADGESIQILLSLHTAQFVQLQQARYVTAVTSQASSIAKFVYLPHDGKIVHFLYFYNRENFLYFEEVSTASSNETNLKINTSRFHNDNETETSKSGLNSEDDTDIKSSGKEFASNGTVCYLVIVQDENETETSTSGFNSEDDADIKSSGNESSASSDAASLVLLVGELVPESDRIQHYQWKEEVVVDEYGIHYTYSVTLENGTACYLAFEQDGKPVENPCLEKEELSTRAQFVLYPTF